MTRILFCTCGAAVWSNNTFTGAPGQEDARHCPNNANNHDGHVYQPVAIIEPNARNSTSLEEYASQEDAYSILNSSNQDRRGLFKSVANFYGRDTCFLTDQDMEPPDWYPHFQNQDGLKVAHIYPHGSRGRMEGEVRDFLTQYKHIGAEYNPLPKVNDARNLLILWEPIEYAFDKRWLSFGYDPFKRKLKCIVFIEDEWMKEHSIDGMELKIDVTAARPCLRLLAYHTFCCVKYWTRNEWQLPAKEIETKTCKKEIELNNICAQIELSLDASPRPCHACNLNVQSDQVYLHMLNDIHVANAAKYIADTPVGGRIETYYGPKIKHDNADEIVKKSSLEEQEPSTNNRDNLLKENREKIKELILQLRQMKNKDKKKKKKNDDNDISIVKTRNDMQSMVNLFNSIIVPRFNANKIIEAKFNEKQKYSLSQPRHCSPPPRFGSHERYRNYRGKGDWRRNNHRYKTMKSKLTKNKWSNNKWKNNNFDKKRNNNKKKNQSTYSGTLSPSVANTIKSLFTPASGLETTIIDDSVKRRLTQLNDQEAIQALHSFRNAVMHRREKIRNMKAYLIGIINSNSK